MWPENKLRLSRAAFRCRFILGFRVPDRLPLHVRGRVRPSARQRDNMVLDVTRAGLARQPSRWTRVRQLELTLDRGRSGLSGRSGDRPDAPDVDFRDHTGRLRLSAERVCTVNAAVGILGHLTACTPQRLPRRLCRAVARGGS